MGNQTYQAVAARSIPELTSNSLISSFNRISPSLLVFCASDQSGVTAE
jgi:hypothetical protein